jgi:hypothetical protein
LAAAVAAQALGIAPGNLVVSATALRIGERAIPLDSKQRALPQYFPRTAFKELPYWRVLSGEVPSGELQGKVALIGFPDAQSAEASTIATPVAANLPNVVAVASATSSFLNNTLYSRPLLAIIIEWSAIICVILVAAFVGRGHDRRHDRCHSDGGTAVTEIRLLLRSAFGHSSRCPAWRWSRLCAVRRRELIDCQRSCWQSGQDPSASLRTLPTFQQQGQPTWHSRRIAMPPTPRRWAPLLPRHGFERRRQNQGGRCVRPYRLARSELSTVPDGRAEGRAGP